LETRNLPSTFTVTSAADSGPGSLRDMIQMANAQAGLDTIQFNIPGRGAHTIALASALPVITDPVKIDGTTQPGFDGAPIVQLDGTGAGANVTGLYVFADNSTVQGLVISNFSGSGIVLVSNNNVVQGDYVGTDLTGKRAAGNGADGIAIYGGAQGNRVGTNGDGVNDAAERNVISANSWSGIAIAGSGTNQNVVAGNFIGTDVTGTANLGNLNNGVTIFAGAQGNRIGADGADADPAGERNVIAANHWSGVAISDGGTNQNVVAGNFIGTDATGTTPLGNLNLGVGISNGAQENRIGTNADGVGDAFERNVVSANSWQGIRIGDNGTIQNIVAGNYIGTDKYGTRALGNHLDGVFVYNGAAANRIGSNLDGVNEAAKANVISGNQGSGVVIRDAGSNQNSVQGNFIGTDVSGTHALGNAGTGVTVLGTAQANPIRLNAIYGNGGLGIDLGGDSVTMNDRGDGDTGPNLLQNDPVILSAGPGSSTTVTGTLNSTAGTTFTLDFYASTAPDRSRYGQGERYLGSAPVTTDAAGNATFSLSLPAAGGPGEWLSATATDPFGNTSEFSQARPRPTAPLALSPSRWTAVGPAPIAATGYAGGQPFSGKINAVAADPTDPDIIYIGASLGGVWKTINGGKTWTPLTDNQASQSVGALALAPSNPDVIYAGTGDTTYSGNAYYGRGLLKSTNGGATWTLLANNLFDRRAISKIVVDPSNPAVVYLATGAGVVNGLGGNVGVWKSTDGGTTWTNLTTSIANINPNEDLFSTLLMDPGDPTHQTLYTAVCSPAGQYFGFSTGAGVYKTTDGGTTWTRLGGGMLGGVTVGNVQLALCAGAPQTVYASVVSTGQAGSPPYGDLLEMLKSTDGGSSWTKLTPPDYFAPEHQGWFDTTLAVDPSGANVVFAGAGAGTNTFIESRDGGASWTDVSLGSPPSPDTFANSAPHADHHGIGFDASGRLLDGDDGGLFRLDNPLPGSVQWTDLNGNLQITQFTGIALDPTDPNIAYGGSQDNGTAVFNGALGWTALRGGDGGFVRVDPNNPATIYHTYQWDSGNIQPDALERSDDGGATWVAKTTGINPSDATSFYPPYRIDPSDSARLLLGTNRVYESSNHADSWAAISPVLSSNPNTYYQEITALAVAPSSGSTIYVATADGHIFVTQNDGGTWQAGDIPGISTNYGHIADLEVDPANSLVAYAVRDQFNDPTRVGHVFRTTDGGQTWSDVSGNLPDLPTYALAIDPRTGALYAGNDNGVYLSVNAGASWSRLGAGFPNVQVVQLELSPTLGILAAGTHGRGMWELALPGLPYRLDPSATTVTVLDANNDTVTGRTGTMHYSSSTPKAPVPADSTFTSIDRGTHAFTKGVLLKTAGSTTLTAADTRAATNQASQVFAVNPGPVTTLLTGGFPSPTTAGVGHSITVAAADAYGNTVTGYTGTARFTSSDNQVFAGNGLPADDTFTSADQGVHTFTNGAMLKTADSKSITATDTGPDTGSESGTAVAFATPEPDFLFDPIDVEDDYVLPVPRKLGQPAD
jgi:photosystem II stability/assembly factor-like uncharacterized protein